MGTTYKITCHICISVGQYTTIFNICFSYLTPRYTYMVLGRFADWIHGIYRGFMYEYVYYFVSYVKPRMCIRGYPYVIFFGPYSSVTHKIICYICISVGQCTTIINMCFSYFKIAICVMVFGRFADWIHGIYRGFMYEYVYYFVLYVGRGMCIRPPLYHFFRAIFKRYTQDNMPYLYIRGQYTTIFNMCFFVFNAAIGAMVFDRFAY